MKKIPQQLPPDAANAWHSYQQLLLAKHRHRVLLSDPIPDQAGIQDSLRHHENCIAAFRKATKDLQQINSTAHMDFLQYLANEPDT